MHIQENVKYYSFRCKINKCWVCLFLSLCSRVWILNCPFLTNTGIRMLWSPASSCPRRWQLTSWDDVWNIVVRNIVTRVTYNVHWAVDCQVSVLYRGITTCRFHTPNSCWNEKNSNISCQLDSRKFYIVTIVSFFLFWHHHISSSHFCILVFAI